MKRRFVSWGLCLGVVLMSVQLLRAIGDDVDPAEVRCAQNLHRIGITLVMYTQDYDEFLPLAYERETPGGVWRWDKPAPVPGDWRNANSLRGDTVWVNSLRYYMPIGTNLYCPATLPAKEPDVNYSIRAKSPQGVSYTYNGYLHSYPLAGIVDLGTLPVVWEGLGREHRIGFAYVNPILRCDRNDKQCRYTPCTTPEATYPLGEVRLPTQSVWIHRTGMHWVMMDGKVVSRRLGARIAPNSTNPLLDPFDQYDQNGVPSVARTNACGHLPLFTPR